MVRIHISIFQKWEWFCFTSTLLYSFILFFILEFSDENCRIFSFLAIFAQKPHSYEFSCVLVFAHSDQNTRSLFCHNVRVDFFPVTFCVRDTMSYWHFICGTFCLVTFCLWLFVRVTFCPETFCVCGILSVTFCPSDVLSCNILSMWHFVRVSFCPVAFCPWHFVRVTFCPCDILS